MGISGADKASADACGLKESLDEVLYRHFGFRGFRHPQEAVIRQILGGRDVMVVMPTGGGKSLCYQLPALLLPGLTLVVSPLIALMKDQVDALKVRGIAADLINSAQSLAEQNEVLHRLREHRLRLLYVAPERLRNQRFLSILSSVNVSLLAVDEAHCLSQWGHDFRPDYLRIVEALRVLPRPTVAAFTATATPEVRDDILRHLNMTSPEVVVSGFERPNLSFVVRQVSSDLEKVVRIKDLVAEYRTGIIYCATRKSTEYVAHALQGEKIPAGYYHGGLSPDERDQVQNEFMSGRLPLVVATNAFGMGIDRADIRMVVHYEMPGSIEAYYQEAGRAGRDGRPAWCEMLFCYADKRVQEFFIDGANPDEALIRGVYRVLLREAGDQGELELSTDDLTELVQRDMGRINPMAVSAALSHLNRMGAIERYDIPGKRVRGTRIPNPDLTPRKLVIDGAALREKHVRDLRKLQAVVQYAYSHDCRQQWVLRYFGETDQSDCGRCDSCAPVGRSAVTATGGAVERVPEPHEHELVLKILSGVARACRRLEGDHWQPMFGRSSIIDSLRGSRAKKIVEGRLGSVSTYGLLRDYPRKLIEELVVELERIGLLKTVVGDYPLLCLTPEGSQVMRGKAEYRLIWPQLEALGRKESDDVESEAESLRDAATPDEELLRLMKRKRMQLAQVRKIPSYCILPNKVLEALAALQPASVDEALAIPGIGEKKAREIVPTFLRLIAEHRGRGGSV